MSKKIKIKPGNIQETLFLPLWGRAIESKQDNPKIFDPKAIEIIDNLDYDFSKFSDKINWISRLSWVARSLHIDTVVFDFINHHPDATIVNIGCGLDTTSERIKNANIQFYNLDLPEVIELRSKLFSYKERGKSISSSFLDPDWIEEIKINDCILFIAAGIFYFFDENQINNFFKTLADHFENCEVFFDSASPLGVKIANKNVLKKGGMDESVILKWGIKTAKIIENWDNRIKLIKEFPMFTGLKKGYPFKTKFGLWISDLLKIMSMVHLRIENDV